MKRRLAGMASIIFVIAIALNLSGCWDKVEINNRAFVLAIAVDKFDYREVEEKKRQQELEKEKAQEEGGQTSGEKSRIDLPQDSPRNRIVLTIVFPNVGLLTGKGGLIPEEMKFPLSIVGPNLYEASRDISTRLNKEIFFGHTKAVLVGQDLARDRQLFLETLDELARDHEISRKVYFAIVEGKAKDVLFLKPKVEPIIGTYIEEIFEDRDETARFLGRRLGDILRYLHETGNALAPRLVPGEEELKVAGSCVIKDYRLVGHLGEIETRAVQWIDNKVEGGVITVDVEGISVPFEVTQANRDFKISIDKKGNIHLNVKLEAEGNIQGHRLMARGEVMDDGYIRKVQKAVSQKLVSECSAVMDKMQHQFGVDVWGIADNIRKFHPDLWEKIKGKWDEVFPEIKVTFSTEIYIRRIGVVR